MIDRLREEASKCQFCGFCELFCPTYRSVRMRHYGPRGRINIIKNFYGEISPAALAGVMSCLVCGACDLHCPAGIKIAQTIHDFKAYLVGRYVS